MEIGEVVPAISTPKWSAVNTATDDLVAAMESSSSSIDCPDDHDTGGSSTTEESILFHLPIEIFYNCLLFLTLREQNRLEQACRHFRNMSHQLRKQAIVRVLPNLESAIEDRYRQQQPPPAPLSYKEFMLASSRPDPERLKHQMQVKFFFHHSLDFGPLCKQHRPPCPKLSTRTSTSTTTSGNRREDSLFVRADASCCLCASDMDWVRIFKGESFFYRCVECGRHFCLACGAKNECSLSITFWRHHLCCEFVCSRCAHDDPPPPPPQSWFSRGCNP